MCISAAAEQLVLAGEVAGYLTGWLALAIVVVIAPALGRTGSGGGASPPPRKDFGHRRLCRRRGNPSRAASQSQGRARWKSRSVNQDSGKAEGRPRLWMSVKDRTREFSATVQSLLERTPGDPLLGAQRGGEGRRGSSFQQQQHGQHSEFTRRATDINGGIQRVLGKLEKLTKCTGHRRLMALTTGHHSQRHSGAQQQEHV